LQQLLARAIEDFKKFNKTKGIDFAKKFQALVEQYFPTGTLEQADPDLTVDISIVLSSDYEGGSSPTPEAT
jgi:hypothetical protein